MSSVLNRTRFKKNGSNNMIKIDLRNLTALLNYTIPLVHYQQLMKSLMLILVLHFHVQEHFEQLDSINDDHGMDCHLNFLY
jgi:hypothetical protein